MDDSVFLRDIFMIQEKILRFTIPFHMKSGYENKSELCQVLMNSGWEQEHIIKGENDLYSYITDLVNENNENDIASSWKKSKDVLTKNGFFTKVAGRDVHWEIQQVGLVIFTTGVGIFWYEIDVPEVTEISQLTDFIYTLKELAWGKNTNHYMAEGKRKISLYEDILREYIRPLEIDTFFANRRNGNKELIPDRAIAFSWACEVTNEELSDEMDVVFHLGRSYKSSYAMSSNISEEDFYMPFDDSIWYSCLEGCSNYTYPRTEKPFYTRGYKTRLNTYFYLYILCLGQYYSLLELAHEVSVLPTDDSKYDAKDDRLEILLDKIHVFNLKNNYSQVGHLTQHNEFYAYMQRRLGINKMQQELEVELQVLYEMMDRKKSIRQAKFYKVFSIIGALFVALEAYLNVADMYESAINSQWGYFVFGAIGCVALAALGFVIWIVGYIGDSRRGKKRR